VEVEDDRPDQHHRRQQRQVAVELGETAAVALDVREYRGAETELPGGKEGDEGRADIACEVERSAGAVPTLDQRIPSETVTGLPRRRRKPATKRSGAKLSARRCRFNGLKRIRSDLSMAAAK